MYTLYGGCWDRSHLTAMVCAELGIPFEFELVDTTKGEHRDEAYLAINPTGLIPALRTPEDEVLFESPAINLYLAERHEPGLLAPVVGDPDRGLFLSSLFYLTDELEPALKRCFFAHRHVVREGDEAAYREIASAAIAKIVGVIDQRLQAEGPFHLFKRYSLPDLVLGFWLANIIHMTDISKLSAVNECWNRVQDRPAIRDLFAEHRKRADSYAEMEKAGLGTR